MNSDFSMVTTANMPGDIAMFEVGNLLKLFIVQRVWLETVKSILECFYGFQDNFFMFGCLFFVDFFFHNILEFFRTELSLLKALQ